jgi:hypothetical protein
VVGFACSLHGAPPTVIRAEALRDAGIDGFRFPESEATITHWIATMDRGETREISQTASERIQRHGWGLWTALTAETEQARSRQPLRVFETWFTPQELAGSLASRSTDLSISPARTLAPLEALRQFSADEGRAAAALTLGLPGSDEARVTGFVKFDPTAADHILQQGLLSTTALNQLLLGGAKEVPSFPATALALKCVFQVIKAKDLVNGRYYLLKAWSGPPAVPQAWPPSKWPGAVWIDLQNGGQGQGGLDERAAIDGSTRTERSTYPLSSLIHFSLSAREALAFNAGQPGAGASPGDEAILVAMHVAGREIARWTWQTFWWTPAPDNPPLPSSAATAARRPAQLEGAPRHYAMAIGYSLLSPDQPHVGGENTGAAVYAYNPWLEAGFTPADLPDSEAGLDAAGQPSANNTGVQTNCMSCHLRANYNPRRLTSAPRYSGARYVDLDEPQFVGTLQVDFLWSLPASAR